MSRRAMAAELGVTKNACIGKMDRMGLRGPSRETKPITMPSAPHAKIASPKFKKPVPARRQKTKVGRRLEPASAARRGFVKIMGLTDKTCRWPLFAGNEAFHMKHYCGGLPVAGSPYCKAHLYLAYGTVIAK